MILDDVKALLSEEGLAELQYIQNEEVELSSFLLSRDGVLSKQLLRGVAEQISSKKLLRKKQPALYDKGILCEKSLLEQSTAEEVARYRASLFKGATCIDCTGGMGIDLLYMMANFDTGVYCELDEARAALFSYNKGKVSAAEVVVHIGDSMRYLADGNKRYDLLFVDPARRDAQERFFSLERSMPNLVEHWELLLESAEQVVVKLSPMIDISRTLSLLPYVQRVEVISLGGEVKEVMLVASRKDVASPSCRAILLRRGVGVVAQVDGGQSDVFSTAIGSYLFDSDAAVVKAGLVGAVAEKFSLGQVNYANWLLSGDEWVEEFPGRTFRVCAVELWQRKAIKKFLKKIGLTRATVVSRGFSLSVQEIRKQFSLGESDSVFLFFTVDQNDKKVVIHCERVYA